MQTPPGTGAQRPTDRPDALQTSTVTVQLRARERFYEGGLQGALERSKPDRLYKRSLWKGVPKRL
jgi:hypothetical protein